MNLKKLELEYILVQNILIDHGEPVDHGVSNYTKEPKGDKRFIKDVLKRFERFD